MTIDCSKCLENQSCCGIMIFKKEFIERFKDKIQEKYFKILEEGDLVHYFYEDCRCPFLNRITRLCEVYDFRPDVCKNYGYIEELKCPFFKRSGNRRSKASETKTLREIDRKAKSIGF